MNLLSTLEYQQVKEQNGNCYTNDMLREGSRWLTKLVFPVFCLGCSLEGEWICSTCHRSLSLLDEKRCAICKKAANSGLCTSCQAKTGLDGVVAMLDYHQPIVSQLVGAIKYRHQTDALQFFVRKFERLIDRRLPSGETVITFVPQATRRHHERGFNQAELLALHLAKDAQPVQLLDKIAETPPQAQLNKKDRENNLKKAFQLRSGKTWPERVLICDDVITTGTTLSRVAKLLRKKGVEHIWAVTIAHD